MCTHISALYSFSYSLSPTHPSSHWCQPSPLDRICSAPLFSDFVIFLRCQDIINISEKNENRIPGRSTSSKPILLLIICSVGS
jgi:hypothetical protein